MDVVEAKMDGVWKSNANWEGGEQRVVPRARTGTLAEENRDFGRGERAASAGVGEVAMHKLRPGV